MLHVNASTVRSRLAKARKILRMELQAGGERVKVPEDNLQKISANHSEKKIGKAW